MNFDVQYNDMTLTLSNPLKLEIHPISGLHQLRIGTSGRLLWAQYWSFNFHEKRHFLASCETFSCWRRTLLNGVTSFLTHIKQIHCFYTHKPLSAAWENHCCLLRIVWNIQLLYKLCLTFICYNYRYLPWARTWSSDSDSQHGGSARTSWTICA